MMEWLTRPWPWYVAGPLFGLAVPVLLLLGNRAFGISSNFRHICAACLPRRAAFFRYDWWKVGGWNLVFAAGILVGGVLGGWIFGNPDPVAISSQTTADLQALGVQDFSGLHPRDLFSWSELLGLRGLLLVVVGGFLVGFGTAYGGGCTSGHGISGLASFQLPSLLAVISFFAAGILSTYFLLPLIL